MVQTLEREERREKTGIEKRGKRKEKRDDTHLHHTSTSYILHLTSQRHHHPRSYRFITGKGDA
jgi:hypothetical protein